MGVVVVNVSVMGGGERGYIQLFQRIVLWETFLY